MRIAMRRHYAREGKVHLSRLRRHAASINVSRTLCSPATNAGARGGKHGQARSEETSFTFITPSLIPQISQVREMHF